jgi:hypothetical protein
MLTHYSSEIVAGRFIRLVNIGSSHSGQPKLPIYEWEICGVII